MLLSPWLQNAFKTLRLLTSLQISDRHFLHNIMKELVLARYGTRENDTIRCDITQNIAIQYDTIRCINATSNLTHFNTGVSSSMNVCCCCSGCEPGQYSRTTIAAKQLTWARAQTISNVVVVGNDHRRQRDISTGDNGDAAVVVGRQLYAVVHNRRRCISGAAIKNSAVSIVPGFRLDRADQWCSDDR